MLCHIFTTNISGVGFNLKRSDARKTFAAALPGVDFDAVYGGAEMETEQCLTLFEVNQKLF